MRKVLTVILILLCLNCFSFTIARIALCLNSGTAARFERAKPDREDNMMTYLIAGNLNQPTAAFDFLKPELSGNLTYVQFRMIGWDAQATAENIAKDIQNMGLTQVNVYTISLGDHVGRYLEEYLNDKCKLQIIAINPCTDVSFMCTPLKTLLKIGAPIFEVVCHGLGWLSTIPFIPTPAGGYSLILLADQYWSIAYDRPKQLTDNTIGVICSNPNLGNKSGDDDNDGLLENAAIRRYFRPNSEMTKDACIITIPTSHGDTIGRGDDYLQAVQQILYGESR